MFKLKSIELKYQYSFNDDLVPVKYIPDCVKELKIDIYKLKRIQIQSEYDKDKGAVELCVKLQNKLCSHLEYFEDKIREYFSDNKKEDAFVTYYTDQF